MSLSLSFIHKSSKPSFYFLPPVPIIAARLQIFVSSLKLPKLESNQQNYSISQFPSTPLIRRKNGRGRLTSVATLFPRQPKMFATAHQFGIFTTLRQNHANFLNMFKRTLSMFVRIPNSPLVLGCSIVLFFRIALIVRIF